MAAAHITLNAFSDIATPFFMLPRFFISCSSVHFFQNMIGKMTDLHIFLYTYFFPGNPTFSL